MNSVSSAPIVIAGPCLAESYELLREVAEGLLPIVTALGADFYFKASFDKANRTSASSPRGPGLETTMTWFQDLKAAFPGLKILTDVHEVWQVKPVAQVVDCLQIPAFLCRQTDLLIAAVESGRAVSVKKGQFMAPHGMKPILQKARSVSPFVQQTLMVTERGASFGYGDLVVDSRSFPILAQSGAKVIFDITHSTQKPPAQEGANTSGALRWSAPLLARCAAASGYLSGFFLEVHPTPAKAQSDKEAQLTLAQAKTLLEQSVPLIKAGAQWKEIDQLFG